MKYAEVAVDSPWPTRSTFSYEIPEGMELRPGQGVSVPFGDKVLQGVVFELTPSPSVEETKKVISPIESQPLLSSVQLQLARWISARYMSSLFESVAPMLPPEFRGGRRLGPKYTSLVRLLVPKEQAQAEAQHLREKRATKQGDVFELLSEETSGLALAELVRRTGCTRATVAALEKKGLVGVESVQVVRDPLRGRSFKPTSPHNLTPAQEKVWSEIEKTLVNSRKGQNEAAVFLLHGVTGSGKTEIYLRALASIIKLGKKGIVLVPELALTPQTIERFGSRFPGRIAVLHSGLTPGERFDEWWRIKEGAFDVVIGSRSAIFAPQPDLKLIVIDEEHEWTYKQQDVPPCYHARDVAVRLSELTGAVVILGSATPDLGSYHLARSGVYRLLELPERVPEDTRLPRVEVVDMRRELREGNRNIFSRALRSALASTLAQKEQAILFLNRRGTATFVQCRDCGFVLRCKRCDVSYTYHSTMGGLVCHYCNGKAPLPELCPSCGGRRIRYMGSGTQRIEEEVRAFFPEARLLRWDRDTTMDWRSHDTIMGKFLSHEADILIGTQMIAKGLHMPLVTLVGIVNADIGLHLPDFRVGERVFQVLSQVAGRAGRGEKGGKVVIQTYSPQHYAVLAAARHDYAFFYERESLFRREHGYPPFNRLARLLYTHPNVVACQREGLKLRGALEERVSSKGITDVGILGPSPAYMQKVRGRFRWHIILRSPDPSPILEDLRLPRGWTLDMDPVSLL
ncbi:MAG: primosomal protein N' [Chloroflexi bacterium]|nr:primosomal protein N' [Chloroflexota bacterium]